MANRRNHLRHYFLERIFLPLSSLNALVVRLCTTAIVRLDNEQKIFYSRLFEVISGKFKEKVGGVLEAVQRRTAKGLPRIYHRIFRLEQLVTEVVSST